MSEEQPTPSPSSGDDDFLSGDGPATFGGFNYTGGIPGIATSASITGRPPEMNVERTDSTINGSDFVGWSYVAGFTLEVTETDSSHRPGSTVYADGGRPSSSDPTKGFYCTGVEAHTEIVGGGGGGGGGGNKPQMRMNVTRTWTELTNP